MGDLTGANSRFFLTVPDVFSVAQELKGYATDDAFASQEIDVAEAVIGVDTLLSSAWVPVLVPMTIMLQADSPSILGVMEAWYAANKANRTNYFAQGTILLPAIDMQYQLQNGILQRVTPFPHVKKMLQPVSYMINWQNYAAQPMVV